MREDIDRMADDGCPNFPDDDGIDRAVDVAEIGRRFCRRHRNVIHAIAIGAIVVVGVVDGFKPLDLSFFGLSIIAELLP